MAVKEFKVATIAFSAWNALYILSECNAVNMFRVAAVIFVLTFKRP